MFKVKARPGYLLLEDAGSVIATITSENAVAGVLACAIAGLMNGSFAVPMKRIQQWKWEHIWFAYTLFANALLPCALALAIAPGIFSILASAPGLALRVMFF